MPTTSGLHPTPLKPTPRVITGVNFITPPNSRVIRGYGRTSTCVYQLTFPVYDTPSSLEAGKAAMLELAHEQNYPLHQRRAIEEMFELLKLQLFLLS